MNLKKSLYRKFKSSLNYMTPCQKFRKRNTKKKKKPVRTAFTHSLIHSTPGYVALFCVLFTVLGPCTLYSVPLWLSEGPCGNLVGMNWHLLPWKLTLNSEEDSETPILLPPPPECWDYKARATPHLDLSQFWFCFFLFLVPEGIFDHMLPSLSLLIHGLRFFS